MARVEHRQQRRAPWLQGHEGGASRTERDLPWGDEVRRFGGTPSPSSRAGVRGGTLANAVDVSIFLFKAVDVVFLVRRQSPVAGRSSLIEY